MLSTVRSPWITLLAGIIAAVVLLSVAIGLASPDGSVGIDDARATPTTSGRPTPSASPKPSAAPKPKEPTPTADLAPVSVRGPWPGRPRATKVDGSKVDWCPAVRTRGAGEADRVFGKAAARRAACAAVEFVFDQRYSRLALPRRSYDAKDLDFVLRSLTPSTAAAYRTRVAAFVGDPGNAHGRDELGLVLFRGEGTSAGARHAAAGNGHVFYGKAYTTSGYRNRAVWINPTWSRVTISVDRSKSRPRILATLQASAAIPVYDTGERRDDMLTVPTEAAFFLSLHDMKSWRIDGWTITRRPYDYGTLAVQ